MIKKLTDRVFYMPHSEETDRPSLGLICGNKYSLIVDSGNSPKHAREFLSEIEALDIPPVRYLVITHWHWDHIFGIKEMDLVTIAHENIKEDFEKMKKYNWDDASLEGYIKDGTFSDFTVEFIKKEMPDRKELSIGDLDIIIKDSIEIDLGGVTCIIKGVEGSHTDDSLVVYAPEEKVVFLGDCVYGTKYNGVYGYTKEKLFPMIEKIEEFDAEHYIISHEELCDKKEMDEFWSQLRAAEEVVGKTTSAEEAIKRFSEKFGKEPSEDEVFCINCFANVNKAMEE
ncbi:MBL fold metallo-hydrolase [Wukongibacter baidiensis]|uniref:MBL fold metallo-hydrolase n=1 Tax=Wukongibacter baidiensis TaxID=1723361 RepID=UPI003D7F3F30